MSATPFKQLTSSIRGGKVRIVYDGNGHIERAFIVHAASAAPTGEPVALSDNRGGGMPLATIEVELEVAPHELHEVVRNYRVDSRSGTLVKTGA